MKTWFLHVVIGWLTGLTKADFQKVYSWVAEADHVRDTSVSKKALVDERMKAVWPKLSDWVLNLLRELAVAYFKKKSLT